MQLLSRDFKWHETPHRQQSLNQIFFFFSLTEFYIKNNQRFPPKKKTLMSFSALILCLPHSKSLTFVFHILSLLRQDRFSKKLQQTPTNSADEPSFFEYEQPTIYWLTAKLKKALVSMLSVRELQISLSVWKKQGLRERYGKGRQLFGSRLSAAH